MKKRSGKRLLLLTLLTVVTSAIPRPLFATRGSDDYGLFFVSGLIFLCVAFAVSAVIYFMLDFWVQRSGKREGRYWTTLLGFIIGATLVIVIIRLAPLNETAPFRSIVPDFVKIAVPILAAIAGFFTWRRKPAASDN